MPGKIFCAIFILLSSAILTACGGGNGETTTPVPDDNGTTSVASQDPVEINNGTKGSRDNSIVCMTPAAPGTATISDDTITIDISNASDGYICATYTGDASRTRIIITTPSDVAYSYDLTTDVCDTFPLTEGGGSYNVGVYDLISGNDYSILLNEDQSWFRRPITILMRSRWYIIML